MWQELFGQLQLQSTITVLSAHVFYVLVFFLAFYPPFSPLFLIFKGQIPMYRRTSCGNTHCSPREGVESQALPPIHMESAAASFHLLASSFTEWAYCSQRFDAWRWHKHCHVSFLLLLLFVITVRFIDRSGAQTNSKHQLNLSCLCFLVLFSIVYNIPDWKQLKSNKIIHFVWSGKKKLNVPYLVLYI